MSNHIHQPARAYNFSLAFEQQVNFVAIADTRGADETLRELLLQCCVLLGETPIYSPQQLVEAIERFFGLQMPEHEVQDALDGLLTVGSLRKPLGTSYTLAPEVRAKLQAQIEAARALEQRVKKQWLEEVREAHPALVPEDTWRALQAYLARAFRRHGLQAAALLDPLVEIRPEYARSLRALLNESLQETLPSEQQEMARGAISNFLATVGQHPDRATYIAQLADGAFSYFSLIVAPEVAQQFRHNLIPLTLFLDTNFLFGILDLHVNSQVETSNDLLRVTAEYGLPFDLRYHEATDRELRLSIEYYATQLRRHRWSVKLSRAATTSRYISGVELRYHQLHAATGVDVDTFLRPYAHVDILLEQKGIHLFKPNAERQYEHAQLLHEYQEYLETRRRRKSHDLVAHDTYVLDTVMQLRSEAANSLDAGALLMTCDYSLFDFDWKKSRAENRLANTILPNLFWQILRPFIPPSIDFDRSFAETFAIPEFRTIRSDASQAASRLLGLLTVYKAIPEQTASKLLSNDLLIDRLRSAASNQEFQAYVDEALMADNAALLEEIAIREQELTREREQREARERELDQVQQDLEQRQVQMDEAERQRRAREEEEHRIQTEQHRREQEARDQERSAQEERIRQAEEARQQAEDTARQAQQQATQERERREIVFNVGKTFLLSVILITVFEMMIYLGLTPLSCLSDLTKLSNWAVHLSFLLTAVFFSLGCFMKGPLRIAFFVVSAIALAGTFLQTLGQACQ